MSRAIGETVIQDAQGNLVAGATVDLFDATSGLRLTVPVYADATSSSQITLPFTSVDGRVVFYLALGQLVKVQVTKGSLTTTEVLAVVDPTA